MGKIAWGPRGPGGVWTLSFSNPECRRFRLRVRRSSARDRTRSLFPTVRLWNEGQPLLTGSPPPRRSGQRCAVRSELYSGVSGDLAVLAERQITKGSPPAKHPLVGLLISQALGAFNDNAWKQIVVLLAITALELVLMLLGTAVLFLNPAGGIPALLILGLLGVQAALFSPSKYGILPEILPHEKLSSGNGLMEMWTSLAIIGGTVAGPIIVSITSGRAWLGGLLLAAVSAMGLIAALGIPRVPATRSEGGLAETFKLAWSAVRADRILRLAILGQVIVWSIASLVPAPVLAYAMKTLDLPEWMSGFPLAAVGIGIG